MLQILPYASAVLLTFLVTLSAFPAITMQVNLIIFLDKFWRSAIWQGSKVNFLTISLINSRLCPLLDMIRYGGASSMCLWPAFYFSTLAIMSAGFCSHPPILAHFWPSNLTPIQVSGGAGPVAKTRQAGFLHHPWTCTGKVCTWLFPEHLRDSQKCIAMCAGLCSSPCSWYATFALMIAAWLASTWPLTLPTSS